MSDPIHLQRPSAGFSSNAAELRVTYRGAGTGLYDVETDVDGDGIADVPSATTLTEEQLNELLERTVPVRVSSGKLVTADGQTIQPLEASVVTDYSTPPLPRDQRKAASPEEVGETMRWLDTSQGLQEAAFMWLALSELAKSGISDVKLARSIKHMYQKHKMDMKEQEIEHGWERIANEKKSAWLKFAFNVGGAVIGAVSGIGSAHYAATATGHKAQMASQAFGSLGYSLPFMMNGMGDAVDKNWGYQKRVYEEQMSEKEAQKAQESSDQSIEDARSNEEEAREQFRQAKKLIEDHNDRQLDINRKITSITF